jgi:cytochrome c oxidase subunit 2
MLKGIEGVSTYANDVDTAFIVVTIITLGLFIVTIGSMLYFVYKYHASKHAPEETKNIKHYTPIEVAWTVIPTILMMIVFYFGLDSLRIQRTMPKDDDAIIVKVLAQRWSWQFEYQNGKKSQELYIPVNQNIKLVMTAPKNDVLHSFYVPAFRAKEDVLPGQTTYLWFNIQKEGKYDIQCAEYCGTRHSYMRSFVHVVSQSDYENFLKPPKKAIQKSAVDLFNDYGCTACHTLDGSPLVGPSFKDNYNKEVTVISNGKTRIIKKDENYLKNSILNPNDDVVEGFAPNMMPSFKGQIAPKELDTIINYFKTGSNTIPQTPKLDGEEIIQSNGCLGCHSLEGNPIVGPTFKGIFKRTTRIQKAGATSEIVIDEAYLKRAILQPKQEVVEGYPNIMPSFKGILKEDEVDAVIEYLKTVK